MSSIPIPPYDDLDTGPYSIRPPVDLTGTLYPEKSTKGLGRLALEPQPSPETDKNQNQLYYFTFAVERWLRLTIGDFLGMVFGVQTRPKATTSVLVEADRYFLFVQAELDWELDLEYFGRVVRVGSLQESRSATEQMLFKTTMPGGEDRRPLEEWHSGLIMWLRDLKAGSIVTPEVIAGGVWLVIGAYLYMRHNDNVICMIDGISFTYVVSPADVASKKPIEVLIPDDVWSKVTKRGPFKCKFTVEDVVGNRPGGKWTHSKFIELFSELDPSLLMFPLVLVNGEVVDQLDLDIHSTAKIEVVVELPFNRPTPNPLHKVTLIVETTDQSGVTKIVRLPPINDRNRRSETILISNALVTPLAGGGCRFWFELATAGGRLLGTSSSTLLNVVGTPTLMPPIELTPYEAGYIAANIDVNGKIPTYFPHDPKLLETVIFEQIAPDGGGARVPFLQLAGPQGGTRLFSKELLKVFENKGPGEVYIETDDGSGKPSAIRRSQVLSFEIGDRVADLPPMLVPDALSGNFDITKIIGNEWLMYITASDTRAGDIVSWTVLGKDAQSSATGTIDVTKATAGITLTTLAIANSTDLLKSNKDASVRISYSVQRSGTPPTILRSAILELTVGAPVVLGLLKILEADPVDGTLAPRNVTRGATLEISGKSIQAGDEIACMWQGQYDVSRYGAVVAGVPNVDKINVPIPAQVLAKAIRPGGNAVTVSCQVRRGTFVYKFATLNVRLLPLDVLSTPRIRGFENTTVLPVDQLGTAGFIDIAPWDFMLEGQFFWATVIGTFAEGTPYTEDLAIAQPVTASDLTKGVSLALPVDTVRTLKEGSALEITAWVSFPGIPSKQTATQLNQAHYQIQLVPAVLPFPTLNGAASNAQVTTVDPLAIQNNVGVTVAYVGMLTTDSIRLEWHFENGTLYQTTLKGLAGGKVVFDLTTAQVLHNSVNSRVQLQYFLVRGGKTTPSSVQTVTVGTIAQDKLPRPLINGLASGAALVYDSLIGDAKAAVPKWPLAKAGQTVTLSVTAGGRELKVLDNYVISAAEATNGIVDKPVSNDWIAAIPHQNQVSVKCSVNYAGNNNNSGASVVLFPVTLYTADTKLSPPVISQVFTGGRGDVIPNGGTVNIGANGFTVILRVKVARRPFNRTMRLRDQYADGYNDISIAANVTQLDWLAGYAKLGVTTVAFIEDIGNVSSAGFSWTKVT